jgi:hypothetical protein
VLFAESLGKRKKGGLLPAISFPRAHLRSREALAFPPPPLEDACKSTLFTAVVARVFPKASKVGNSLLIIALSFITATVLTRSKFPHKRIKI